LNMGRPITVRHTGSEGDLCDSLACLRKSRSRPSGVLVPMQLGRAGGHFPHPGRAPPFVHASERRRVQASGARPGRSASAASGPARTTGIPDQCRREGGWRAGRLELVSSGRLYMPWPFVRCAAQVACAAQASLPVPGRHRWRSDAIRSRSRQRPARTAWRRSRVVLRRSWAVIGARAGAAGALRRPARQRLRPSMARGRARACRRPRGSRPPTSRPRPQGDR
jgi:hypothetical protein